MFRCIFIAGIATFLIILMSGCGGNGGTSEQPPLEDISDESLHTVRIGTTEINPFKPNLVALSKTNTIQFQFLKKFHPSTFGESIRVLVGIKNITRGWTYGFTESDIVNNGAVSFENNQWGSLVIYSGFDSFDFMTVPKWDDESSKIIYQPDNLANPGDKLLLEVGFLSAKYDDSTVMLLKKDEMVIFSSGDVIERPVDIDDLDSGGMIQSIKFGEFVLTDKEINIIPLQQVYDILVDFNTQLNPYKFKDLLDFRIVINNLVQDTSFVIDRGNLDENGELFIVDYVSGRVKFRLYDHMPILTLNGLTLTTAIPGDLIEVNIDFFNDEDIYENDLSWQNKKFRIFYASI